MDNASIKKHETKFMVPDTINTCQVLHCNVGDIVDFIEKPISDAEENKEEQSVLD